MYFFIALANLNPQKAQIILSAHYDLANHATFNVFANLSAQNALKKLNVTSITRLMIIMKKSSLFQLSQKYINGPNPSNLTVHSTMKI